MIRKGMVIAGVLLASACVSVLPEAQPPAPRYTIDDVQPAATSGSASSFSLAIDDPQATRAVDTAKIATVSEAAEYRYYADAEWADRAPRLFQSSLIRSFQNVSGLTAVGSRSTQPIADYILQTDIRSFEARHDGDDVTAAVKIYARITDIRGRSYGARLFSADQPVSSSRGEEASGVAAALNTASGAVLNDIVGWSLETIAAREAAKKSS